MNDAHRRLTTLLVAHVVNGDADLVMVDGGDMCRQPSLRGWRDVDDMTPKNRISLYLLVLRYPGMPPCWI